MTKRMSGDWIIRGKNKDRNVFQGKLLDGDSIG